jgi:hypothetical protein
MRTTTTTEQKKRADEPLFFTKKIGLKSNQCCWI